MRNLLLFFHVLGAIVLIGPTTAATSVFARYARAGDLTSALDAHRTSRAYGTASIVVPAIGLVLTARISAFGDLWVQVSLGLFAAAAVVLMAVHLPAQRASISMIEAVEPVPPSLIGRLRASAGIYALTWVAILWFMIAKPA